MLNLQSYLKSKIGPPLLPLLFLGGKPFVFYSFSEGFSVRLGFCFLQ